MQRKSDSLSHLVLKNSLQRRQAAAAQLEDRLAQALSANDKAAKDYGTMIAQFEEKLEEAQSAQDRARREAEQGAADSKDKLTRMQEQSLNNTRINEEQLASALAAYQRAAEEASESSAALERKVSVQGEALRDAREAFRSLQDQLGLALAAKESAESEVRVVTDKLVEVLQENERALEELNVLQGRLAAALSFKDAAEEDARTMRVKLSEALTEKAKVEDSARVTEKKLAEALAESEQSARHAREAEETFEEAMRGKAMELDSAFEEASKLSADNESLVADVAVLKQKLEEALMREGEIVTDMQEHIADLEQQAGHARSETIEVEELLSREREKMEGALIRETDTVCELQTTIEELDRELVGERERTARFLREGLDRQEEVQRLSKDAESVRIQCSDLEKKVLAASKEVEEAVQAVQTSEDRAAALEAKLGAERDESKKMRELHSEAEMRSAHDSEVLSKLKMKVSVLEAEGEEHKSKLEDALVREGEIATYLQAKIDELESTIEGLHVQHSAEKNLLQFQLDTSMSQIQGLEKDMSTLLGDFESLSEAEKKLTKQRAGLEEEILDLKGMLDVTKQSLSVFQNELETERALTATAEERANEEIESTARLHELLIQEKRKLVDSLAKEEMQASTIAKLHVCLLPVRMLLCVKQSQKDTLALERRPRLAFSRSFTRCSLLSILRVYHAYDEMLRWSLVVGLVRERAQASIIEFGQEI